MREGRDTVRHNGRTTILLLIGVAVVVAAIWERCVDRG